VVLFVLHILMVGNRENDDFVGQCGVDNL